MRLTWSESGQLNIRDVATAKARSARRGETAPPVLPPPFLQSPLVSVERTLEVSLPSAAEARRGGPLPLIALDVEAAPEDAALVVLRHPSGAITFHPGTPEPGRRGRAGTSSVFRFRIPVRQAQTSEGRRGLITQAIKAVVLKVAKPGIDKIVEFVLPKLARMWEEHSWSKRGLREGWFRVSPPSGAGPLQLIPGVPDSAQRNLLFIHGTFSNAESGFGGLKDTDFFARAKDIYDDRIFAFNHFTVSRSPQENVQALLQALPNRKQTFDAITHSRGGLILRTMVERAADFGGLGQRFQLGRAVLVASPNDGTPLATPERWDRTVGWMANLLEIVNKFGPDNPFVTGAEFVSEAIVWLAHHLSGDLPGLRAMDGGGETISDLQEPPPPPQHAYSALVANFHPDNALWARIVDSGVDQFFGGANDLVVPTEGGWRVDRDGQNHVDANEIGCYGPGGNLATRDHSPVIHTNFFSRQETAVFLERALAGKPQNLSAINTDAPLPDRRFSRSGTAGVAVAPRPDTPRAEPKSPAHPTAFVPPSTSAADTFHLVVLEVPRTMVPEKVGADEPLALLYASYAGARAIEPFGLRGGDAGKRFQQIIDMHERIKDFADRQKGVLPSDSEMVEFGRLLFATLFPGKVKRLYDTARSLQLERNRTLDIIFTSMISWVAEKPWEFAFDPDRQSFLATEEIHFVRNVLTSVPADSIKGAYAPLKILVASAQPVGLARLSIEEEIDVIRRGFEALIEKKLVEVDILPRATVPALHGYLSTGKYNVLHFIGHGTFDDKLKKGFLVFENTDGGTSLLDERSARELLCQRGLDLVFLNACQSSAANSADFNKGLAQSLVAHGIPALVANQYSVLDTSATSFAQFFYWALARGMSLGRAAKEARISVNYSLQGDPIDWAVPVLYARDSNDCLLSQPDLSDIVAPVATVTRESRRAIENHAKRIAVWDVDHALPKLRQTLDKLNAAQSQFGFEVTDLSAPLDSFEIHEKDGKRTRYLRADQLARRLQSKTAELHVNYLLCITGQWMRDEETLNLYAWWPENQNPPVLVLSYAGFHLDPSGLQTDRALANGIVSTLAGVVANLDAHEKGPRNCPMYYDEERDISTLTGEQRFDRHCAEKINRRFPEDLAALNALLRVFDEVSGKQGRPKRP